MSCCNWLRWLWADLTLVQSSRTTSLEFNFKNRHVCIAFRSASHAHTYTDTHSIWEKLIEFIEPQTVYIRTDTVSFICFKKVHSVYIRTECSFFHKYYYRNKVQCVNNLFEEIIKKTHKNKLHISVCFNNLVSLLCPPLNWATIMKILQVINIRLTRKPLFQNIQHLYFKFRNTGILIRKHFILTSTIKCFCCSRTLTTYLDTSRCLICSLLHTIHIKLIS